MTAVGWDPDGWDGEHCDGPCRHTAPRIRPPGTPGLLTRIRRALRHRHRKGAPVIDPDRPCPHETFDACVEVKPITEENRIVPSNSDPTVLGHYAGIKVSCHDCGEPFRWTGVPIGASQSGPMCSADGTELSAPLHPASADLDFGLGLPRFSARYRPGPEGQR